ncbi:MAG: Sialic acid-specific 9-O-acetylesterase [Paenibacillaceae bacterium]|nr:Sialic acid-specific 9-O-acetylesterase [Paenibacillaceae bacterium]
MDNETKQLWLPKLFGDNMVIQQGKEAAVWGRAAAGQQVTVRMAGQEKRTATGSDGRWLVHLDPLPYGGPHILQVSCGQEVIAYSDVYLGEVWLCGGQSNMAFRMAQTLNFEADRKTANYPGIRFINANPSGSDQPAEDIASAGWMQVSPETVGQASGVAYYFARALHESLGVPVGLVHSSVGGTNATSWISRETMQQVPQLAEWLQEYAVHEAKGEVMEREYPDLEQKYRALAAMAKRYGQPLPPVNQLIGPPPIGPSNPKRPGAFYNGMIAPLLPYAIKGAIWYQGEANASMPELYEELMRTLIGEWRAGFGQGDFPFFMVQLPGFAEGASAHWPRFRETQRNIAEDNANTGLAVAIDVGTWNDIHPTNKQPVGERLALLARASVYGEDVVYQGPICVSAKRVDSGGNGSNDAVEGTVELSFRSTGSGLVSRTQVLHGFEVCGENGAYVKAGAMIVDGVRVLIASPRVAKPTSVRYAWAPMPTASLYNKEGLPAIPFRMQVE